MNRKIFGSGTSEPEWLACQALQTLPILEPANLVPEGSRLVVCAPHPDDEILPCGGLLAALADLGREISLLAITDGEGSHGPASSLTPAALRRMRPLESAAALLTLELPQPMERLGFPDGGLEECIPQLVESIRSYITPGDVLLTPWELDGHPDHEAVWKTARIVADEMDCTHLETPIWGWHWSTPETTPMPWSRGIRVNLTLNQIQRKERAIREFKCQLEECDGVAPILSVTTLKRFLRPWEVYFR